MHKEKKRLSGITIQSSILSKNFVRSLFHCSIGFRFLPYKAMAVKTADQMLLNIYIDKLLKMMSFRIFIDTEYQLGGMKNMNKRL